NSPVRPGANPFRITGPARGPRYEYIGATLHGSVSVVSRPEGAALQAFTEQVRANCPYTPESLHQAPIASRSVIPDRVGQPCPIRYVLYIIKENRTYDQVFGDYRD